MDSLVRINPCSHFGFSAMCNTTGRRLGQRKILSYHATPIMSF
jgi:hypothetical protein